MSEQKVFPTGVLHFTDTNTFYALPFRIDLQPEEHLTDKKVHFTSLSHTSKAFPSAKKAFRYIKKQPYLVLVKRIWKATSTKAGKHSLKYSPNVFSTRTWK